MVGFSIVMLVFRGVYSPLENEFPFENPSFSGSISIFRSVPSAKPSFKVCLKYKIAMFEKTFSKTHHFYMFDIYVRISGEYR